MSWRQVGAEAQTARAFCADLTWVADTQSQMDAALLSLVQAEAGDGHRAVDRHLVLLAVLGDVEQVWGKLKGQSHPVVRF